MYYGLSDLGYVGASQQLVEIFLDSQPLSEIGFDGEPSTEKLPFMDAF